MKSGTNRGETRKKEMCVLAGCPESTCDCTLGGGGADDETAAYSVAAAAALCAARPPPPPPPPPPGSPLPAGYCGAVSAGGSIVAVRKTPFFCAMFTQKGSVCPDRLKATIGKAEKKKGVSYRRASTVAATKPSAWRRLRPLRRRSQVRKLHFLVHLFYYKTDHFTKTGLGQT